MDNTEIASWKQADKLIYTNEYGKSYSEANEKSQRVSDLVYGDILKLTGQKGNFYTVTYPDGRKGYIKKSESLTLKKLVGYTYPYRRQYYRKRKNDVGTALPMGRDIR